MTQAPKIVVICMDITHKYTLGVGGNPIRVDIRASYKLHTCHLAYQCFLHLRTNWNYRFLQDTADCVQIMRWFPCICIQSGFSIIETILYQQDT